MYITDSVLHPIVVFGWQAPSDGIPLALWM